MSEAETVQEQEIFLVDALKLVLSYIFACRKTERWWEAKRKNFGCWWQVLIKTYLVIDFQNSMCLSGTVLGWFHSYLSDCTHSVNIYSSESEPAAVLCGVSRGSVLMPLVYYPCSATWPCDPLLWHEVSHVCWWYSVPGVWPQFWFCV